MTRPRLEPVWLDDLLGIWAHADGSGSDLGFPEVCPSFKGVPGGGGEYQDAAGYSLAEMNALEGALERLGRDWPQEAVALSRWAKPWLGEADREAAQRGAERVAGWVDEVVGG